MELWILTLDEGVFTISFHFHRKTEEILLIINLLSTPSPNFHHQICRLPVFILDMDPIIFCHFILYYSPLLLIIILTIFFNKLNNLFLHIYYLMFDYY